MLLKSATENDDPLVLPEFPGRSGIGSARATIAAALFLGILAVGWIAVEPRVSTKKLQEFALSETARGDPTEITTGQVTAPAANSDDLSKDPTLTQLAVIEDVAAGVYFQQGAPSFESGIGAPTLAETVRATLGDANGGPEELFRLALSIPVSEPESAATAYALAALSGHDRAAYYLGQMYELGEGAPRNLNIARAWYEVGARSIPGAKTRLDALAGQASNGSVMAPIPLFHRALPGEQVELVWSVAPEATGGEFTIEFGDVQNQTLTAMLGHSLPALRTNLPPGATNWRVGASAGATRIQFSEWVPLK